MPGTHRDDVANNCPLPNRWVLKELPLWGVPQRPEIGDAAPPHRRLLRKNFVSPTFPAETVVLDGFPGPRAAAVRFGIPDEPHEDHSPPGESRSPKPFFKSAVYKGGRGLLCGRRRIRRDGSCGSPMRRTKPLKETGTRAHSNSVPFAVFLLSWTIFVAIGCSSSSSPEEPADGLRALKP